MQIPFYIDYGQIPLQSELIWRGVRLPNMVII